MCSQGRVAGPRRAFSLCTLPDKRWSSGTTHAEITSLWNLHCHQTPYIIIFWDADKMFTTRKSEWWRHGHGGEGCCYCRWGLLSNFSTLNKDIITEIFLCQQFVLCDVGGGKLSWWQWVQWKKCLHMNSQELNKGPSINIDLIVNNYFNVLLINATLRKFKYRNKNVVSFQDNKICFA